MQGNEAEAQPSPSMPAPGFLPSVSLSLSGGDDRLSPGALTCWSLLEAQSPDDMDTCREEDSRPQVVVARTMVLAARVETSSRFSSVREGGMAFERERNTRSIVESHCSPEMRMSDCSCAVGAVCLMQGALIHQGV